MVLLWEHYGTVVGTLWYCSPLAMGVFSYAVCSVLLFYYC